MLLGIASPERTHGRWRIIDVGIQHGDANGVVRLPPSGGGPRIEAATPAMWLAAAGVALLLVPAAAGLTAIVPGRPS